MASVASQCGRLRQANAPIVRLIGIKQFVQLRANRSKNASVFPGLSPPKEDCVEKNALCLERHVFEPPRLPSGNRLKATRA